MARITLTLTADEKDALLNLAQSKRRDPRDQAALILREYLRIAGFLPPDNCAQVVNGQ